MSEQDVAKANKKRLSKAKQLEADYMTVLSGDAGKNVIQDILNMTSFMASNLATADPHFTYERIGRRAIGILVLDKINRVAPHVGVEMMISNLTDEKE